MKRLLLLLILLAFPATVEARSNQDFVAPLSVCPTTVETGQQLLSAKNGSKMPRLAQTDTATNRNTEMLCLHNYARKKQGLKPLTISTTLNRSAEIKTKWIVECNEFAHELCGHKFSDSFKRAGYLKGSWGIGENLLYTTEEYDARGMFMQWLESPGHKKNLLSKKWTEIGLGWFEGSYLDYDDSILWVAQFGTKY